MIIIEIILRAAGYFTFIVGGYILLGALYLWCSIFTPEDTTFGKCVKQSWINTCRMRPWYDKIEVEDE